MSGNARIEPETIEMGYTTVSSTMDYTVEHTAVELEPSADTASYVVHYFVFPVLVISVLLM